MKRALTRNTAKTWHWKGSVRVEGSPTGMRGNLGGVRGDLTGVSGDLDDCKITAADRERGIDIEDLIRTEGDE